jgi:hypothetical protein
MFVERNTVTIRGVVTAVEDALTQDGRAFKRLILGWGNRQGEVQHLAINVWPRSNGKDLEIPAVGARVAVECNPSSRKGDNGWFSSLSASFIDVLEKPATQPTAQPASAGADVSSIVAAVLAAMGQQPQKPAAPVQRPAPMRRGKVVEPSPAEEEDRVTSIDIE